jgi:phenylacetate-CoA ligase
MAADGTLVPVLPLALWSVMKETPGVQRFQAIQTAPDQLRVRLETKSPADTERVWNSLQQQIHTYLARQGLDNVQLALVSEPPVHDPRSGKFRHVWAQFTSDTNRYHTISSQAE